MKTLKASYALLIAVGMFMTGLFSNVMAENYNWDGSTLTGYQPTNGTWETSACWTTNQTNLTTWPSGSTNNAYFAGSSATATSLVTVAGSVAMNQLGLGWSGSAKEDNCFVTLTNGTITVGAGGIIVNSTKNVNIYSDVVLAANQTWDVRTVGLPVYGSIKDGGSGYGITKIGANTLALYGINSFSGDFVQGAGPVTVYSASGLPMGSGSLALTNDLMLSITPAGSGSVVSLLGGTNGNKTLSFVGDARLYINKGSQTSVTYTFGNAMDAGSVFTRIGKGTLAIGNSTSANPGGIIGDANGTFLIANGAAGVPIHNGMVDAYITTETMGAQWNFDFLKYDAVNGLANLTYDGAFTGTSGGINDNTKKYRVTNAQYPILTNNTAVYALTLHQTSSVTLSNNAVLSIGDGVNPAGLIIHTGPIQNAANSTGSKITFGTSEGIVFNGQNAIIDTPIDGKAGVTFNAGGGGTGAMTLTANNLYTGPTTVLGNQLKVGNGGTSGDLGSSSNLVVYSGATVNLNRSDTLNWTGTMSGAGTVQNGGVGTLNLALSSGTVYGGTLANASSGIMNLTVGNSTLGTVQNTSSGTLNVSSVPGTNAITTLTSSGVGGKMTFNGTGVNNVAGSFQGNNASSTNQFTSGTWFFSGPGNAGGNRMGTVIVDGASVIFLGGRYVNSSGGDIAVKSGLLQFLGDRFNPGGDYTGTILISLSGGTLDVANSTYGLSVGGVGGYQSIVQTGGTLQYGFSAGTSLGNKNFALGSSGKAGTNTYTISSGKLRSLFPLSGQSSQTSSNQQSIVWTGGTIAALALDMTKLGGSDGITSVSSNTLINGGGTLAPGDIGTAGKTTITGKYTESSVNAALAIDIGGASQGSVFTNAPGYYDYVAVTSNAYLVGKLSVSLINSYVPITTNKFTILTSTALSGTFANLSGKALPLTDGYSLFTNVTLNATNVILSGYAVNEYLGGSWDSASSWSQGVIPVNQDYAAYFGTLASSFSPNVGTRTLKGLVFANATGFTLSGTALTLQGDASIKVTAGSHIISVPLALSNATEIAVATNSVLTLTGGITGGQAVTKTGTGTLALSGVNTLGALTISAGTVQFAAGATTVSGLTLSSGAKCDFTAGTLYIQKNGGGTDTIEEVNAAITANSITLRGKNAVLTDFKVTEEGAYIKVMAMLKGTVISFQ